MMGSISSLVLSLSLLLLAATGDSLAIKPGCRTSCGGVDIPYPFGIGAGCFRPGFEIACPTMNPVLAATKPPVQVMSLSVMPRPEARVMLPVAYICYNQTGGATDVYSWGTMNLNPSGVYRISNAYNELFVLGCSTFGFTNSGNSSGSGRAEYMYYTGCAAYCNDARSAKDGACAGVGCCHVDIPPGLTDSWMQFSSAWAGFADRVFSPCDYAFIVEKGYYSFRAADLLMDATQASMPLRLDWAIRDSSVSMSCAQAVSRPGYTCVSRHSHCVDSTNGPGYVCNCTSGYEGNPYVANGCTNINECARPREEFPCNGVCRDTEGSYVCKCRPGYQSNGDPKENPCNPRFTLAAKLALGITIGAFSLVAALLSTLIMLEKRKAKKLFEKNGGMILQTVTALTFFKKEEIMKITKNHSESLGKGSFGKVYKGTLPDNTTVAVKSYIKLSEDRMKEFTEEVKIQLGMIHGNVLRLLGCCLQLDVPMLVYEFAAKGSLGDILHVKRTQQNSSEESEKLLVELPIEDRLDIAIGSAKGLSYMHNEKIPIRHGDVKPDNILLDDKWTPKISDFGLSKLLEVQNSTTDTVMGSVAYMDPVFRNTGLLTLKSDVYSFGVVLLELISRKKSYYGKSGSLIIEFRSVYEKEKSGVSLFDEEIADQQNIFILEEICKLAIHCLKESLDGRPDMPEVVERLEKIKEDMSVGKYKATDDSSNSTNNSSGTPTSTLSVSSTLRSGDLDAIL